MLDSCFCFGIKVLIFTSSYKFIHNNY
ncbi:hypothetical protein F8S12_04050 [Nostoc sp. WHI]|nr:hypothetical protein [Nostoc sp. WHI]